MFENLEKRNLFSTVLQAGVLTVTGTSASEEIHVLKNGGNLTVIQTGQSNETFQEVSVLHIVVNANGGNDRIDCSTDDLPVEIHGGSGNDTMFGGSNNDDLFGDSGNDVMHGGAGKDALHGGSGNDDLDGGLGDDFLDGQDGKDTADYSSRNTSITAELELQGTNPSNNANHFNQAGSGGQAGEQDHYEGIETLAGGSKADKLDFLAPPIIDSDLPAPHLGDYAILGNGGNDSLSADGSSSFDDNHVHVTLSGGSGNDALSDNAAIVRTFEFGGSGNDTFTADEEEGADLPGPRVVDAGSGTDTEIVGSLDVTSVTLGANLENFKVETGSGLRHGFSVTGNSLNNVIDVSGQTFNSGVTINGAGGDDSILGTSHSDKINGGSGNDTIHGEGGNDTITGDSGKDKLFGDAGNDTLFAKDSTKDSVDGGSGTDKAQRDAGLDVVSNVESFI